MQIQFDNNLNLTKIYFFWKNFQIDRNSFENEIRQITSNFDGLLMDEAGFHICIKGQADSSVCNQIQGLYNSLNQSAELEKINRPSLLKNKIKSLSEKISTKSFLKLNPIEKKLISGSKLTLSEENYILSIEDLPEVEETIEIQVSENNSIGQAIVKNTTQNLIFQIIGQMNSSQYLVSGIHSVSGLLSSSRRSGNSSNGYRYENSAPNMSTHSGKIISATASIRGIACSEGTPAQNLQLFFELWKVGFTSEGVKLGNIVFNINSSNYTIGSWWNSSVNTNFAENQSQNVSVQAGDLLALKFISQSGNNKVVSIENTTVNIEIQKDYLS